MKNLGFIYIAVITITIIIIISVDDEVQYYDGQK